MKHIKPIQIYLGKYGTHPTDVDSDEEKIWKYAESLYGNRCVNSKQKLEIVNRLGDEYGKDVVLNALNSACKKDK